MTLSIDWVVNRDSIAPVYANLIGICVLPFILVLLVILIWTAVKLFRREMKWNSWRYYVISTSINVLFLIHPMLLKATIQTFACSYIEGTSYFDIYMEDECWVGSHLIYVMTVACPWLLVWGIGLPTFAFVKLFKKNKHQELDYTKNKAMYGFLYLGFHRTKYCRSIVEIIRKFAILLTIVWLNRIST